MTAVDKKAYVVICTSGSPDYLKDSTGNRRYWPAHAPSTAPAEPISSEDRALVDVLITMSGEWCDGLHDEEAPQQYLCSRCFPNGREDPSAQEDDGYEETCRDQDREME